MPNLYVLLGASPLASAADIKAAYRRSAQTTHPDTGGSPAAFTAVETAYRTLSDPALRAAYDRKLSPLSAPPPTVDGNGYQQPPPMRPAPTVQTAPTTPVEVNAEPAGPRRMNYVRVGIASFIIWFLYSSVKSVLDGSFWASFTSGMMESFGIR